VKLLPYQRTGVEWLRKHDRTGLYDDQGLGKTVQAAAAIEQLGLGRVIQEVNDRRVYRDRTEAALVEITADFVVDYDAAVLSGGVESPLAKERGDYLECLRQYGLAREAKGEAK